MKKILFLLLLSCVVTDTWALEIDPFKGPKPVAVLIQTNPWLMVIGSDTPVITIYDDGQVVYVKNVSGKEPLYVQKQLTAQEFITIKAKLASFANYSEIKKHYNLTPHVTDQPEAKIYLDLGGKILTTSVYGLKTPETKLPAYTVLPGKQNADTLPESLKKLHEYLTTLRFEDAKPWEPSYVEVMIWKYEYAPSKSIIWPKDWPGLNSPNALRRGDSYSIFLTGKEIPKLIDFLAKQEEKGAVEIDKKKWAVSVRYTFPSEPVWFNAFRKNSE